MKAPSIEIKLLITFCHCVWKPIYIFSKTIDLVKRKDSNRTKSMKVLIDIFWKEFWKYSKKMNLAKNDKERELIKEEYEKVIEKARKDIKDLEKA